MAAARAVLPLRGPVQRLLQQQAGCLGPQADIRHAHAEPTVAQGRRLFTILRGTVLKMITKQRLLEHKVQSES